MHYVIKYVQKKSCDVIIPVADNSFFIEFHWNRFTYKVRGDKNFIRTE